MRIVEQLSFSDFWWAEKFPGYKNMIMFTDQLNNGHYIVCLMYTKGRKKRLIAYYDMPTSTVYSFIGVNEAIKAFAKYFNTITIIEKGDSA